MIITYSNLLTTAPTVTNGASTSLPENVVDQDFSTFYESETEGALQFSFGVVGNCNYVAVAGHNLQGNKNNTSYICVKDGTEEITRLYVSNNAPAVISFTEQAFTDLVVEFRDPQDIVKPIARFIAAGLAYTVPNNGETSGHNRQFLNRSIKTKTTINASSAPVAQLKTKVAAKGSLNIPNAPKEFSETTYQEFLDFAVDNLFFIAEQTDTTDTVTTNKSAYICYDLMQNKVTAHPLTRNLNNISFNYKVFNGL